MKIIIPMSGLGSRFVAAGYKDPKPLIKVHNKPIIEWVIKMLPDDVGEKNEFIFICRKEHVENTNIVAELERIRPDAKIIAIENHKRGPVYAVSLVFNEIKNDEPILISYCDYYMHWNFLDFKKAVLQKNIDGAVPCYTGFHPHLIPQKNLYAGCFVDDKKFLLEIREKFSFEKDKSKGFNSPGAYFFKNGEILKKYFQMALDEDLSLNNEYYVSLVYQLMLRDKLNILVHDKIDYFCQWGTPEDLQEYLFWVAQIKNWSNATNNKML